MTTLGGLGSRAKSFDHTAPSTPGLAVDSAVRHQRLRELVSSGPPLLLPGVVDAIWARLCEAQGYQAVYVSGAGVSNSYLGLADVGLIGFSEMLDRVTRIVEAVPIPVIVDADTGYGGLNAVARAVALFERAGVSGIQFEDQQLPKRCGHFDGKRLVSAANMQARIDAAVRSRRNPDVLVIARTDAVAVEGFDRAIARARLYEEAGADVIFIEAPQTLQQLDEVPRLFPKTPTLFNVVEGGLSPSVSTKELSNSGYRIILHANYLLRSALLAAGVALRQLRDEPDGTHTDGLLSWRDRQDLVRLPDLDAFENSLRERWGDDV